MKFNISYPANGTQKCIDVDDDKKCQPFFDRRMGQEIDADSLGDEWKGYIFKISGGNDKSGFPMKQGILIKGRVKVFMGKGHSCYRPRRNGERKRKTVRGCIVGPDIRVLAVAIVKKGDNDIPGLTDAAKPRRLGPKRANKLKKLFGIELEKKDTAQETALIRQNVIRRTFQVGDKSRQKAPKVQRLITADRLRQKAVTRKIKRDKWENSKKALEEYNALLAVHKKEKARKASAEAAKRKASAEAKDTKKVEPKKVEAPKKAAATTKKAKK